MSTVTNAPFKHYIIATCWISQRLDKQNYKESESMRLLFNGSAQPDHNFLQLWKGIEALSLSKDGFLTKDALLWWATKPLIIHRVFLQPGPIDDPHILILTSMVRSCFGKIKDVKLAAAQQCVNIFSRTKRPRHIDRKHQTSVSQFRNQSLPGTGVALGRLSRRHRSQWFSREEVLQTGRSLLYSSLVI